MQRTYAPGKNETNARQESARVLCTKPTVARPCDPLNLYRIRLIFQLPKFHSAARCSAYLDEQFTLACRRYNIKKEQKEDASIFPVLTRFEDPGECLEAKHGESSVGCCGDICSESDTATGA